MPITGVGVWVLYGVSVRDIAVIGTKAATAAAVLTLAASRPASTVQP